MGSRKNVKVAFMDLYLDEGCEKMFVEVRGRRINSTLCLKLLKSFHLSISGCYPTGNASDN